MAIGLVSSIILSIFYETLLPLLRAEQWLAFFANIVGIPIILAGTCSVCWGAWMLLRGPEGPNPKDLSQILRSFRPGLLWFFGGFGLIALGSYISNIS